MSVFKIGINRCLGCSEPCSLSNLKTKNFPYHTKSVLHYHVEYFLSPPSFQCSHFNAQSHLASLLSFISHCRQITILIITIAASCVWSVYVSSLLLTALTGCCNCFPLYIQGKRLKEVTKFSRVTQQRRERSGIQTLVYQPSKSCCYSCFLN